MGFIRTITILLVCASTSFLLHSQDTNYVTPFRKGRTQLALLGSLTSTGVQKESLSLDNVNSNDYLMGMKLATFPANRFMIGMDLRVTRAQFGSILNLEQEELSIGPLFRYYISGEKYGSLFPQLTLLYYNFYNSLKIDTSAIAISYILDGYGFGAELAFGYSYIIVDRVNIEVGIGYSFGYMLADLEDEIAGTTEKVDYFQTNLRFYFGMGILFGRIRNKP